jgi:two-component system, chemotaxis family, sensor kinase CheA
VGELLTVNHQIREVSQSVFSEELAQNVDSLGRITGDLYQQVLQVRMVPVSLLTDRLPRVVRDLGNRLGKEVRLTVEGKDVEIDRSIMDSLMDPLLHLVRNALDHGLETKEDRAAAGKDPCGKLSIRTRQAESTVTIDIEDDGRGIDRNAVLARAIHRGLVKESEGPSLSDDEVFEFLQRPGFSTRDAVSDVSGRGVGLDVVKEAIETLGGEMQIRSELGRGTRFRLRLPTRVTIIPVFLVRAGEQTFAIPIAKVSRARWINREAIQNIGGRESVMVDGEAMVYWNLARLLGIQESFFESDEIMLLEMERGTGRALFGIDAFLEEREVYLKMAPRPLDRLRGVLGVTLVRGVPVYVLDPGMMVWTHV